MNGLALLSWRRVPVLSSVLLMATLGAVRGETAETAGIVEPARSSDGSDTAEPSRTVVIDQLDGRYRLLIDGEPFAVRGAGIEGRDAAHIMRLAGELRAAGGNTMRTWASDLLPDYLAAAERYGLKVLVGLDVRQQLSGFDYGDEAAVAQQFAAVRATVQRFRAHPAILGWLVINEANLMVDAGGAAVPVDPRVYDAVADIVDYLHRHDPGRPASISFAFTATLEQDVRTALARVPALDIVSFQAYGALPAIPEMVERLALDRPFMITEYGALGHWELPATDWGREVEQPSGPKADDTVARMALAVNDDPTGRLLGAFAFLWGQKQERTPTWYGLFTADGRRTAMVDELQRAWTGAFPADRAPRAESITLDRRTAFESVTLTPGQPVRARVVLSDEDVDALQVRWTLRSEVQRRSAGGHVEITPPALEIERDAERESGESGSDEADSGELDPDGPGGQVSVLSLRAPSEPGEYRLFVEARDAGGGAATANIPFRVAR